MDRPALARGKDERKRMFVCEIGKRDEPTPETNLRRISTHQIGDLFLVVSTFFVTRLLDQWSSESNSVTTAIDIHRTSSSGITIDNDIPRWPERGYGSHLSLKIYVYDENEIYGLKELMYGRDGSVKTAACLKGQWGSQRINSARTMVGVTAILAIW
ncbi:hypothetical protein Bca101_043985 [Brassica carinata]